MSSDSEMDFPPGFLFGVATSAYQIEGAWNVDGKGESIWDHTCHTKPEQVRNGDNGDVACDSYNRYKEDVAMIKEMGMDFYRFSISWSRIFPTAVASKVNQRGVDYYNNLINELLENNIQPMVTMYHWDLPQPLQEMGGWLNEIIIDYFEDYARALFSLFGDRVKWWVTLNEPLAICAGLNSAIGTTPFLQLFEHQVYFLGAHNLLKAHAQAYHIYQEEYLELQNGKVGISLACNYCAPKSDSEDHLAAVNLAMQITVGLFAHPIFSTNGDYPDEIKDFCVKIAQEEERTRPILPTLSTEWKLKLKGSADFFGLNHYTTVWVIPDASPNYVHFCGAKIKLEVDPSWPKMSINLFSNVPWGFREILRWVKDQYDNTMVIVTENGYCSESTDVHDSERVEFYKDNLKQMLKAIHEDGCNVIGYTAWTLMDNFEWKDGYSSRFGLHYVDFNDPNRRRVPRDSARELAKIVKRRRL